MTLILVTYFQVSSPGLSRKVGLTKLASHGAEDLIELRQSFI
jgi:hypothetical protein